MADSGAGKWKVERLGNSEPGSFLNDDHSIRIASLFDFRRIVIKVKSIKNK